MYCVIVDIDISYAKKLGSEFEAIPLAKLTLPLGDQFLFQYSILELNTAVKPWAIEYLLARGHELVIYVDPDIYFYAPMTDAESLLLAGTDILLTPHLLAPMTDSNTPSELDIRRAGAYNLGFCAVRESANTRSFLSWWQYKLQKNCVIDLENGIFVDQGWIDLVPGLFGNVGILRNEGYNVAYWNLAQRPITRDERGIYKAGAAPLIFFHFSGLNPSDPQSFSKYQNRFTLSTLSPAVAELVEDYVKAVLRNGAIEYSPLEYGFGRFASGDQIPDEVRRVYRIFETFKTRMGQKPFDNVAALNDPFLGWMIGDHAPSNAMAAVWIDRPDLQQAFPLKSIDSIGEFYRWFVSDPSLKRRFPATVMARHEEMAERWIHRRSFPIWSERPSSRGTRRVLRLYAFILDRAVDPAGMRSYTEMCNTLIGYLRAWRHIGFSQESRCKPRLISRIARALILSM
jgi:hypothetical protein